MSGSNPLGRQVGGDHYTNATIQPIEYMMAHNLGYIEGAVVKYVTRWELKGGIEDLEKAKHLLEILIDYVEKEDG
ncbi:MAG: DUF3310 domain-containing protein [Crocinitomix sp.]|nr:DUF3310 domain-containing protein [Crocinitomix sp.]